MAVLVSHLSTEELGQRYRGRDIASPRPVGAAGPWRWRCDMRPIADEAFGRMPPFAKGRAGSYAPASCAVSALTSRPCAT